MSFRLKRSDDVTATIVDRGGDEIRTLADNRRLVAGGRLSLVWDGTDERGRMVPDGIYRVRLSLRRQGRSILIPRNIEKDTRPPSIRVTSIGPVRAPGPELLPRADGRPAVVRFTAPTRRGARKEIVVLRTDVRPARPVFDAPVKLADDATSWRWNATAAGRRVAAGTYLVVVRARDLAGNVGTSVDLPLQLDYGRESPVAAGSRSATCAPRPSTAPVRGRRGRDRRRRVGGRELHLDAAPGRRPLDPQARPRQPLAARALRRAGRHVGPVPVRGAHAAAQHRGAARRAVPAGARRARHPAADDLAGAQPRRRRRRRAPEPAGGRLPVRLGRPFVKDGIPAQVRRHEALLLAALDRKRRRYDITTDAALARGEGPKLDGHRGVIVAGDARWLDAGVARALRTYVRAGGRLLSVGTQSLRRGVRQTPRLRAIEPTLPTTRDLFGARLAPIAREPVALDQCARSDRALRRHRRAVRRAVGAMSPRRRPGAAGQARRPRPPRETGSATSSSPSGVRP